MIMINDDDNMLGIIIRVIMHNDNNDNDNNNNDNNNNDDNDA